MRRLRTTIRMRNSKRRAIPTTRAPRSITCSRSRSRLRGVLVAELSNARQFRLTDAPAPADPGPNQIQVAVKAVGICGSDLHYFGEGGMVEPLAVALHSMQFAGPQPGETAVVFGAGPIGLLTIAVLKLAGVTRIWAVEPVAARRALALALGADAAIDPGAVDPVREILHDTAHRGVDMAIDCAARTDSINQCIHAVRNAGRVVVTGIPSEDHIQLAFHMLRRKEAAFYSVRRSNHDSGAALRLLAAEARRFVALLTTHRPLAEVQPPFQFSERYAHGVGKSHF